MPSTLKNLVPENCYFLKLVVNRKMCNQVELNHWILWLSNNKWLNPNLCYNNDIHYFIDYLYNIDNGNFQKISQFF